MTTPNRFPWPRGAVGPAACAVLLIAAAGFAWAQDNDGMRVLQSIDGSVRSGWSYLKTAAALIVGGGFLAAGGRAMTRGDWTGGTIGIGFGAVVLVAFFALGKTLGLG
ncbi:MAG: hypothetical protein JO332_20375 [Planctomycetaceae bacterium]|nr:hypothetical protein [Planctomycetaceae bacterium]